MNMQTQDAILAECDDFTRAYVEAIYFTETGDMGQPDSDCPLYAVDLADAIADCRNFQMDACAQIASALEFCGVTDAQLGYDFWLTRNGHGAGFWDGDYDNDHIPSLGDDLTELAKKAGEVWVEFDEAVTA